MVKLYYIRIKCNYFIVLPINVILKHQLIQVFAIHELSESRFKQSKKLEVY